jgi:STE24 endopeptidase
VSLPLAFYSGYLLEHRYGLSRLSLRGWLWRRLKAGALGLAFGGAMVVGLYWLIWTTGYWWWLAAAGAAFVVSVLIGQLAPVLIFPLFYKIERYEDDQITPRLKKLAEGTGLKLEGVYRMNLGAETVKANAALAGLGRTRRVLLADTLLENFSPDEIEVIFGHEVGHHVFRHIPKLILFGAAHTLVGFWLTNWAVMSYVHAFNPALSQHELPIWTLPLLLLVITLFSLLIEPLQNALSRRFERQCDRYALDRTGLRAAYISAFRKLARLNKSDPDPPPLEVFWLHNHPPISERLAMAER